nr:hypothetical protein [Tanacetum cinerariifolium]
INRKDKVNQDAESGTMVRNENLSPQQPPQAHTSSTEKVPTSDVNLEKLPN